MLARTLRSTLPAYVLIPLPIALEIRALTTSIFARNLTAFDTGHLQFGTSRLECLNELRERTLERR